MYHFYLDRGFIQIFDMSIFYSEYRVASVEPDVAETFVWDTGRIL